MDIKNKKVNYDIQNTFDKYNKNILDAENSKQFKLTLSKNLFFLSIIMTLLNYIYFYNLPPSMVEVNIIIVCIFLFFVSMSLFAIAICPSCGNNSMDTIVEFDFSDDD